MVTGAARDGLHPAHYSSLSIRNPYCHIALCSEISLFAIQLETTPQGQVASQLMDFNNCSPYHHHHQSLVRVLAISCLAMLRVM
jgi:hypothetical protein